MRSIGGFESEAYSSTPNCGYSSNADYNRAMNILKWGTSYISMSRTALTQPELDRMKVLRTQNLLASAGEASKRSPKEGGNVFISCLWGWTKPFSGFLSPGTSVRQNGFLKGSSGWHYSIFSLLSI